MYGKTKKSLVDKVQGIAKRLGADPSTINIISDLISTSAHHEYRRALYHIINLAYVAEKQNRLQGQNDRGSRITFSMEATRSDFLNGCESMIVAADATIQTFQSELASYEMKKHAQVFQDIYEETRSVLMDILTYVPHSEKERMNRIRFEHNALINGVWAKAESFKGSFKAASITIEKIQKKIDGYKSKINGYLIAFVNEIKKLASK